MTDNWFKTSKGEVLDFFSPVKIAGQFWTSALQIILKQPNGQWFIWDICTHLMCFIMCKAWILLLTLTRHRVIYFVVIAPESHNTSEEAGLHVLALLIDEIKQIEMWISIRERMNNSDKVRDEKWQWCRIVSSESLVKDTDNATTEDSSVRHSMACDQRAPWMEPHIKEISRQVHGN